LLYNRRLYCETLIIYVLFAIRNSCILLITTFCTMIISILLNTIAGTYRRKAKRDLEAATSTSAPLSSLDVLKAQEMILKEMGPDACVYEKVCSAYAEAAALAKKERRSGKVGVDKMDWEKIIRYVMLIRYVIRIMYMQSKAY